jgi:hypothetical protein
MRRKWFFLVPLMIAAFIAIGGAIVMYLWNWLVPALFGLRSITFWQALGVLVLCRILFGGFGGRGSHRPNFRRRMADRWEKMTPEEREKFGQSMRSRCGGFGAPTSGAKEPA